MNALKREVWYVKSNKGKYYRYVYQEGGALFNLSDCIYWVADRYRATKMLSERSAELVVATVKQLGIEATFEKRIEDKTKLTRLKRKR